MLYDVIDVAVQRFVVDISAFQTCINNVDVDVCWHRLLTEHFHCNWHGRNVWWAVCCFMFCARNAEL